TGLEHVDRELPVMPARLDLRRGRLDRVGHLAGYHAQRRVDVCGGRLDAGQRRDVRGFQAPAGDRAVLRGALGLGAVQRVRRYPHLPHGVPLDPKVAHAPIVPARPRRGDRCRGPGTAGRIGGFRAPTVKGQSLANCLCINWSGRFSSTMSPLSPIDTPNTTSPLSPMAMTLTYPFASFFG